LELSQSGHAGAVGAAEDAVVATGVATMVEGVTGSAEVAAMAEAVVWAVPRLAVYD